MATSLAHDEQVSFYAASSPLSVFDPGYGGEFATQLGNRSVVGLALEYTEPEDPQETRDIRLRSDVRLLYSSDLETHWYPLASVQWLIKDNQLTPFVGAGFQRELVSEVGFFGETLWKPYSTDFQVRLGFRFWIMRFQSLDARVRSANPVGAIYQGGGRANAPQIISETEAPETLFLDQGETELLPLENQRTGSSTSIVQSSQAEESQSGLVSRAWYVHLGIFQELQNLTPLKGDPRISNYRQKTVTWFDDEKDQYRLLIGPYPKPKAQAVMIDLKKQGVDSFLFRANTQ